MKSHLQTALKSILSNFNLVHNQLQHSFPKPRPTPCFSHWLIWWETRTNQWLNYTASLQVGASCRTHFIQRFSSAISFSTVPSSSPGRAVWSLHPTCRLDWLPVVSITRSQTTFNSSMITDERHRHTCSPPFPVVSRPNHSYGHCFLLL